jgi:hypothetical protein
MQGLSDRREVLRLERSVQGQHRKLHQLVQVFGVFRCPLKTGFDLAVLYNNRGVESGRRMNLDTGTLVGWQIEQIA